MDIIPNTSNVAHLSLYNALIIIYNSQSKMNYFTISSRNQALDFSFIIEEPPPNPSDFRFVMKKSLYKHFYTKTSNSAIFDVENGPYTVFPTNQFLRVAITK